MSESGNALEQRPDGWWRSAVVYQVYPRSFADSDGDGIGDLPGVIDKLDYLQQLGVDVLWLSPVYRSPQDDNGYDISDYHDIDSTFGTMADVDELIDGLHRRGMKLVMDLVVNHTSDEHEWFQESINPDSDKADWYWWAPARDGHKPDTPGAEPYNWRSAFSGPAWTCHPDRGEYYLHIFSTKQPDLNWENPAVRQAVYEMMNWWVDRGVDGFRMDVINLISKTMPLKDGPVAAGQVLSSDPSGVTDGPRLDEFLHEMHQEVLAGKNLLAVGEMPGATLDDARSYTAEANEGLNMVFQFEHVSVDEQPGEGKYALKPLHLPDLKHSLGRWQYALAESGWNSLYWNNHDQPRIVSRWGDDSDEFRVLSAKTLGTVLHMLKGTPYIYQGEELGMTNAYFTSIDQYKDIEAVNFHAEALRSGLDEAEVLRALQVKSRDNSRTPMQWDDSENAGFTTGKPWLPVTHNHQQVNVAEAVADPDSVFHHYRQLIQLRHDEAVVRDGTFELLLAEHEQLFCYTRTLAGQQLLILANMSSRTVELPSEVDVDAGEILLVTHSDREILLATHSDRLAGRLRGWESRIIRIR